MASKNSVYYLWKTKNIRPHVLNWIIFRLFLLLLTWDYFSVIIHFIKLTNLPNLALCSYLSHCILHSKLALCASLNRLTPPKIQVSHLLSFLPVYTNYIVIKILICIEVLNHEFFNLLEELSSSFRGECAGRAGRKFE